MFDLTIDLTNEVHRKTLRIGKEHALMLLVQAFEDLIDGRASQTGLSCGAIQQIENWMGALGQG
jgi:hypothetical protein